jgi:hypothetical protein
MVILIETKFINYAGIYDYLGFRIEGWDLLQKRSSQNLSFLFLGRVASERRGNTVNGFDVFYLKLRPSSDLDYLVCAT